MYAVRIVLLLLLVGVRLGQAQASLSAGVFVPQAAEYVYEVSWQGIPAAEVKLRSWQDGQWQRLGTWVRTYSFIDMFYELRYEGSAWLSKESLNPIKFSLLHKENSIVRISKVAFKEGEVLSDYLRVGRPLVQRALVNDGGILDPFSAALRARGIDWTLGATHVLEVFNGRGHYQIELTAVAVKELKVLGTQRQAWEIVPKVFDLEKDQPVSKLKSAKIYLSTDDLREVLSIESDVFVGTVRCELREVRRD